jgi:hypothetical protein
LASSGHEIRATPGSGIGRMVAGDWSARRGNLAAYHNVHAKD